jgi:hypothetical protein
MWRNFRNSSLAWKVSFPTVELAFRVFMRVARRPKFPRSPEAPGVPEMQELLVTIVFSSVEILGHQGI